jgi:hypothetical protein
MSTLANEMFVKRAQSHDTYIDELRSHKHGLARVTSWAALPKMWILPDYSRTPDAVRAVTRAHCLPLISRAASVEERLPRRAVSEHVQRELLSLVQDGDIPPLAAVRALKELLYVIPADAVFPHVTADENGEAAFYWFAGSGRLEILVPERGEIYCRASGLSPDASFEGFCNRVPVARLRLAIEEITKLVTESNPDWQRVFGS